MRLFLLFILVSLIEIALFIIVGGWLTLWPTLGLVLLTGALGTLLMRRQGMQVLAELRGDLEHLRDPLSPLAHGALIVLGGVFLLSPGFFTDALGFALLVPGLRRMMIAQIGSRLSQHFRSASNHPQSSTTYTHQRATIIEGEFHETPRRH